jgi:hypothetical protein
MIPGRVSLRMIEEDGEPRARLMFDTLAFTVDPAAVSFNNGELRVQIPTWIDVPQDVVVVERWLPPTAEQVRLAVEALDATLIETLMLRQQEASADEPFGAIARKAVAFAVAGAGPDDA